MPLIEDRSRPSSMAAASRCTHFAIYRASHDDYEECLFPTGPPFGTCEDALDTACGLYLNNPTAWT